jgi:hypothetical protein
MTKTPKSNMVRTEQHAGVDSSGMEPGSARSGGSEAVRDEVDLMTGGLE